VHHAGRPPIFYGLAILFALFVVFLYGPIATVIVLAFQGPEGGLVFPMNGVSLHWFGELFRPQSVGDIWGSFDRSLALGAIVMLLTVLFSLLAGLAFRQRFRGSSALFYLAVASLVMPSIVVSLGIGAMFEMLGLERHWYSSALGAQLTWTLPFGLLIMLAVFNRFNPAFEEAARDLGASSWQAVRHVVVPCSTWSIAARGRPERSHNSPIPATTPRDGSSGVVGTLWIRVCPVAVSVKTISVKVPPTSTPMSRIAASHRLAGVGPKAGLSAPRRQDAKQRGPDDRE